MRFTVSSLLVFSILMVQGQPSSTFSTLHYSTELYNIGNSVYGISQDKQGFIWFGTDDGLKRFDGTSFESVQLPEAFPSHIIERVQNISSSGKILIGAYPDAIMYQRCDTCAMHHFANQSVNGSQSSISIRDSSIFFWHQDIIYQIAPKLLRVKYQLPKHPSERFTTVHAIHEDSLFIATNKTALLRGKSDHEIPELANTHFALFAKDSALFFTPNTIWLYRNGRLQPYQNIETLNIEVEHATFDQRGNIWFSGRNEGLYLIQNGAVRDVAQSLGLAGEQVNYLFRDRDGNIWIATESSGITLIVQSQFTNYSQADGLSSNKITCITSLDDKLFIGTNSGLQCIENEKILNPSALIEQATYQFHDPSLLHSYIHGLSTYGSSIFVASGALKGLKYRADKSHIHFAQASALSVWQDTLILGSWGGYKAFDLATNPLKPTAFIRRKNIPYSKEFCISHHPTGHILIGTPKGLYITSSSGNKIVPYSIPGYQDLEYMCYDVKTHNGTTYIATSVGLILIDQKRQTTIFTANDGLSSNHLTTLAFDAQGHLWIGTDNGLNVWKDGKISHYTKQSGLIGNVIRDLHFHANTNTLWVGTTKGLSKLNLQGLKDINYPSFPLYIKQLEVIGDTTFKPDHDIILKPRQRHIRIHFGAINYVNPNQAEFQYRLLNTDSTWRNTAKPQADFTYLTPGQYRFEVRSKSSGATWGEPAYATFAILPPFWQTTWFIVLLLVVVSGSLFFLYKWRINRLKARQEKETALLLQINELEQKALSLSMNPHFVFNSLNSIQQFFSHVQNREANNFIANFAELIRLNMDSSKKQTIRLDEEVHRLRLYLSLEQSRFDDGFQYQIDVDPELAFINPELPNMVIQPLIENAIWHGILPSAQPGKVEVTMAEKDGFIIVSVTDNGIGLTAAKARKSKQHHSQGLAITRKRLTFLSPENRLELHEWQEDGQVKGSIATLYIKLLENDY